MIGSEERGAGQSEIEVVDAWILSFVRKDFAEIDPQVLKVALTELGGNFEVKKEALEALGQYTNKAKRPGLDAVWGKERVDEYKAWVQEWADRYESANQLRLPRLERSGSKVSGMIAFFGELTALAAGQISLEEFNRIERVRRINGILWEAGKKGERLRIRVPTSEKPIRPSSYPGPFPFEAWEYLKTWKDRD